MSRYKRIAEFMNAFCKDRHFKALDVGLINQAVRQYRKNPARLPRTKENLKLHNQNVSKMLGGRYSAEHVRLFKKCLNYEYEYRKGMSRYERRMGA